MLKYILISLTIILSCQYQLQAQEEDKKSDRQHIIHLKNGSSIIGVLMQYGNSEPAIIEVADDQQIIIPFESIQGLEPLNQRKAQSIIRKSKLALRRAEVNHYSFQEKGWHYAANLGLISPGNRLVTDKLTLSLDVNAIYHFSRTYGLGLAIGYESYEDLNLVNFIPVQVVFQGYLSSKPTTMFYSLGAGYGFSLKDPIIRPATIEDLNAISTTIDGGLSLYPKIGVRLSGHDGINTTIFIGTKFQKSFSETKWNIDIEESITQNRTYNRFIIGVGIVF